MKVLIYKRTHKGDPNEEGIFGIHNCMKQLRNGDYDAVIGIGGNSPNKGQTEIKHKINWIGLGTKKRASPKYRVNEVVFAHFELYDENGMNIRENYPNLFKYMYEGRGRRFRKFDIMASELPENLLEEIKKILDSIKDSPKSKAYDIEIKNSLEVNASKCGSGVKDDETETIEECVQKNTICKKEKRNCIR